MENRKLWVAMCRGNVIGGNFVLSLAMLPALWQCSKYSRQTKSYLPLCYHALYLFNNSQHISFLSNSYYVEMCGIRSTT